MNKGMKRIITACVVSALLIAYAVRVYIVNRNYDMPEWTTYNAGEVCTFGDFTYCIGSKEFLNHEQIKERLGAAVSDEKLQESELFMIIGIDMSYIGGKESEKAAIRKIKVISEAWTNGRMIEWTSALNPDGTDIAAGDTKRIYVAVPVPEITFAKIHRNSITERSYSILLSVYPDIIEMRCD